MSMAVHGTSHGANNFCSKQPKHAWLPCHFISFKQYFSHAMIMDLSAMRWCICQAVIEPWTLWSTFGRTNRSVTRSLRQLQTALPTAFLSFAWRNSYLANRLLMMSRWQRRFSDYWYNFGVKGQCQVYLKPVLQLVTGTSFIFDGRCSYLAH